MNKTITCTIITLLLLGTLPLWSITEVKNTPKPLKGEWDFRLEKIWETSKAGDLTIKNISSLRIDTDGRIFTYDRNLGHFFVYQADGTFLYSFGKIGTEPGQYASVFNFLLVGKFLVADCGGTLHYFTKDGKFSKMVAMPGVLFVKSSLDEDRLLFVKEDMSLSNTMDYLFLYTVSKDLWTPIFEVPKDEAVNASNGKTFLAFRDYGLMPRMILKTDGENLYSGMNNQYLINKSGLDGKPTLTFSVTGKEPRRVSDEFKRKRFENKQVYGKPVDAEILDQLVKNMPSQCPFFDSLRVDEKGLIYVSLVDLDNTTGREIDIFSPDGKYLYHATLTLPKDLGDIINLSFKENLLLLSIQTPTDENKLIKFKISTPTISQ